MAAAGVPLRLGALRRPQGAGATGLGAGATGLWATLQSYGRRYRAAEPLFPCGRKCYAPVRTLPATDPDVNQGDCPASALCSRKKGVRHPVSIGAVKGCRSEWKLFISRRGRAKRQGPPPSQTHQILYRLIPKININSQVFPRSRHAPARRANLFASLAASARSPRSPRATLRTLRHHFARATWNAKRPTGADAPRTPRPAPPT